MHDSHIHGSCGECASFVPVFPEETGLDDWGYCREQGGPPPPAETALLHSAYLAGDRASLRENRMGIFRTEPDDGCDFFRPGGLY